MKGSIKSVAWVTLRVFAELIRGGGNEEVTS